jgi:hypothetical protein
VAVPAVLDDESAWTAERCAHNSRLPAVDLKGCASAATAIAANASAASAGNGLFAASLEEQLCRIGHRGVCAHWVTGARRFSGEGAAAAPAPAASRATVGRVDGCGGALAGQRLLDRLRHAVRGGVFVVAGDSMMRQVFTRTVHLLRAATAAAAAAAPAIDHYFHRAATYVATAEGDWFHVADYDTEPCRPHALDDANATVLLRLCFVWDPTTNGARAVAALKTLAPTVLAYGMTYHWALRGRAGRREKLVEAANEGPKDPRRVLPTLARIDAALADAAAARKDATPTTAVFFTLPPTPTEVPNANKLVALRNALLLRWVNATAAARARSGAPAVRVSAVDFAAFSGAATEAQCDGRHYMCIAHPAPDWVQWFHPNISNVNKQAAADGGTTTVTIAGIKANRDAECNRCRDTVNMRLVQTLAAVVGD